MDEQKQYQNELQDEEVNIYTYGCGDPKAGCMVDCINLTSWLTTDM